MSDGSGGQTDTANPPIRADRPSHVRVGCQYSAGAVTWRSVSRSECVT